MHAVVVCGLIATAILSSMAAALTPVDGMLPCRFMVPFTVWTSEAGCPTPARPKSCASDADCAATPKQCTFGPGVPKMKCLHEMGAKVCAHESDALPDMYRPGGYCNATTEVCSLTIGDQYPNVPRCVPSSYCSGRTTVRCYPEGHDITV
jgi:hypothetical protein